MRHLLQALHEEFVVEHLKSAGQRPALSWEINPEMAATLAAMTFAGEEADYLNAQVQKIRSKCRGLKNCDVYARLRNSSAWNKAVRLFYRRLQMVLRLKSQPGFDISSPRAARDLFCRRISEAASRHVQAFVKL